MGMLWRPPALPPRRSGIDADSYLIAVYNLSRLLRPLLVGADRERLIWTEISGLNVRNDKILRRHRIAGQPPQDSQLTGVRHGVGKGTLQESLGRDATKFRSQVKVLRHV